MAKAKKAARTPWASRIEKAEKYMENMLTHGRKVYARYEDKREDTLTGSGGLKKINLFYANVNTIKESLFNSLPKPDVSRRHRGDFYDDVSRVAALILERGLDYEVQCAKDFAGALKAAILDRLVPGLGLVWITFSVDKKKQVALDEMGVEMVTEVPVPGTERIEIESVYWEDIIFEPARSWDAVDWAGRRRMMTKQEITDRWGEEAASQIAGYADKNTGTLTPKEITEGKYCVYEIWDKERRRVAYWAKGLDDVLEELDDPYQLKDFYPFPKPLIANPTTAKFLPVTDYYLCQDQYIQLDTLYARISLIIEAVKVAGCYNGSESATIGRMLDGNENKLIPVENWAMYAEQGGARGLIDWYPVETVVAVLEKLQVQYEAIKAALQEVSGMSDIVRGASNQYETAKAQQIKAQFASMRMNGYQRDTAEFVTGMLGIMAEMMSQLYSPQKLQQIVGTLEESDRQYVEQAYQLLQNDFLTSYRVSVKADSLTQADWALEKEQRMELMSNISQFMQSAVPLIEQAPDVGELLLGLMKWTITGFRGSAEIEGMIDRQLDALAKAKKEPQPPPPPSPEEQKAKVEMQKQQMETARAERESQQKMQLEQQQAALDMMVQRQSAALEERMMKMEMMFTAQMNAMKLAMEEKKMMLEERRQQMTLEKQEEAAEPSEGGDAD